ncbi:DEAD/DEAH box helicase family protein [Rheinheimera muenzenbergensis]|uniref:DEAD/DEAH box helicase family protein n=1 Tax=Rheinheimera muenzenbergensis TaxID=1193628 RepID=A0ABU8CAK4_9GAMM
MAFMYPSYGPKSNSSAIAEPLVYQLFKEQLDDTFHVIHSIPWLSSFVTEMRGDKSPNGEVDFLVIHETLGILAVEVKGGVLNHDVNGFFYTKESGFGVSRIDPALQLSRGVYALQSWFRQNGIEIKIGSAFCFPGSQIPPSSLPPGYADFNQYTKVSLVIDKPSLPRFGEKISEIMSFHKQNLGSVQFKAFQIQKMIEMILPTIDAMPCWISRVNSDNFLWLKLTDEQKSCVDDALESPRLIVNGWPGSGKTIVGIQVARLLSKANKRVLFITFNKLLAAKLKDELKEHASICDVLTLYGLAHCASKEIQEQSDISDEKLDPEYSGAYDKDSEVVQILKLAGKYGYFDKYDHLIVDEGQVIWKEAWEIFFDNFVKKQIVVLCDATQAFEYEKPVSLEWLESRLSTRAFTLTNSLRVPKKICDRLKLFAKPSYTVNNPRDFEDDTLVELITHHPKSSLKKLMSELLSEGIPPAYITVLKPTFLSVPKELIPSGVKLENIGRFRGLESPFVIVYADPKMSNIEFFIAYSRATSRCIALFDAFHIQQKAYGSIGPDLYTKHPQLVEQEVSRSLTSLMLKSLALDEEELHTALPIYWSNKWSIYLLKENTDEITRSLLEIYLRTNSTPLVLTWGRNSVRTLSLIPSDRISYEDDFSSDTYEIRECITCCSATPQIIYNSQSDSCLSCSNNRTRERCSDFEDKLKEIGDVISYKKDLSKEERTQLHAAIYILCGFRRLGDLRFSEQALFTFSYGNKSMSRLAVAFSLWYLHRTVKKNESKVKIGQVSKATREWNQEIRNWNPQSWNAFVNDAFRVFEKYGLVKSESDGWRTIDIGAIDESHK